MMKYGLGWHYLIAGFAFAALSFLAWYFFSRCCGMKSSRFNKAFLGGVIFFAAGSGYDTLQFARGVYNSGTGEIFSLLAMSWLLGCFLSVILLVVFTIIYCFGKIINQPVTETLRKVFMVVGLVVYVAAFAGMYNGWSTTEVNYQQLKTAKYHQLHKFRIAYFSDLHLGNIYNVALLDRILPLVAARKPDVLLIGGDIFDDDREIEPALAKIEEFSNKYAVPVYFVLGNHEYYCNINKVLATLAKSTITLLRNDSVTLKPDSAIVLVGVDYPFYQGGMRFDNELAEIYLQKALLQVPQNSLRLLLAHSPEYIDTIGERKLVDLVLSGHTHGGQVEIGPLNLFKTKFHYLRGRYELPNLTAIVSVGAGGWLSFRYNCPAEINIVDIEGK